MAVPVSKYISFEQALLDPLPEIAVGSNSAKDPSWERNSSHEGKSTLSAMVPANWEWFEEFKNAPKVGHFFSQLCWNMY